MQQDTGNGNILHDRSLQKIGAKATQQIAVLKEIPSILSKSQRKRCIDIINSITFMYIYLHSYVYWYIVTQKNETKLSIIITILVGSYFSICNLLLYYITVYYSILYYISLHYIVSYHIMLYYIII